MSLQQSDIKSICATFDKSEIQSINPLAGGSINEVFKITTKNNSYVFKVNLEQKFPGMFDAEEKGLTELQRAPAMCVPEVLDKGVSGADQYLVLEYLEERAGNVSPRQLGEALASMHAVKAEQHGLEHDNYMGSLPQSNTQHEDWFDFLWNERWEPQLAMMSDEWRSDLQPKLEKVAQQLPDLMDKPEPALLHGDLWIGNYFSGLKGPVIFDPAVYYGDPVVDLAMMHLFGGFDSNVFEAYERSSGVDASWPKRIDLYQIYPLLVHVNLFGSGYLSSVNRAVQTYL